MEIRIGITNTGRELGFETAQSAEEVRTAIAAAFDSAASHLSFTDVKGATYIVPTAGIAYVEVGSDQSRRVGFVA